MRRRTERALLGAVLAVVLSAVAGWWFYLVDPNGLTDPAGVTRPQRYGDE